MGESRNCPKCGKGVPKYATKCPCCGYHLLDDGKPGKYKKPFFIALMAICLLIALLFFIIKLLDFTLVLIIIAICCAAIAHRVS
jgi:predicted amidophosphoribosyltransferase